MIMVRKQKGKGKEENTRKLENNPGNPLSSPLPYIHYYYLRKYSL